MRSSSLVIVGAAALVPADAHATGMPFAARYLDLPDAENGRTKLRTAVLATTWPPRGGKTAFIRSFPLETPPNEFVRLGQALGMNLSAAYIYNIRHSVRSGAPRPTQNPKRFLETPTATRQVQSVAAPNRSPNAMEVNLRRLIAGDSGRN